MTVRRLRAFTALGAGLSLALAAQGAVVSNASWTDREWDYAAIGAVDCANPEGAFLTRGAGQMLSGGLLGIDLDTVAEASGVVVTNDGTRALHTPSSAQPAPADPAYADPLNVALLNDAISLDLSTYLQLPLDNSTGLIGQYARADIAGDATGASGLITESGGIATQPGAGYPHLATLQLSTLLDAVGYDLGQLLAGVADVSLEVGAVAGRAELDGCEEIWSHGATGANREYLATSIDLAVETPTLGAVTSALDAVLEELENTVNGLASNQGVLDSLLGSVTGLLNGLVSDVLGLGHVSLTLQATVDTQPLRDLIHPSQPLSDSLGVLTIDPGTERIVVNTAALLAAAYPGQYTDGLNGLAPNTNLLDDPAIVSTLTSALAQVLGDWLGEIDDLLDEIIDGVEVQADVVIALQVDLGLTTVSIGTITATVEGSVADLLGGDLQAVVTTDLNLGIVGLILRPLVEGLVNTLVVGLVNNLANTVGTVVGGALGALRVLPQEVSATVDPVLTAISGLYSALFLEGIVAIAVNSQNRPATGYPGPSDWTALAPGQYDVAAIRVGVLDTLGAESIHLYLGRGSVGPACSQSSSAACGGY